MPPEPPGSAWHLSDAQVAGYLERTLDPPARDEVETHLAVCADCRGEMVAVARLIAAMPRSGRTRKLAATFLAGAGLTAAAAVLVLAVGPTLDLGRGGPIQRETPPALPEGIALIIPHAPPEGRPVEAGELRFTWQAMGEQSFYRFVLSRADGTPAWEAATADTTLALPNSLPLPPGSSWFWRVDALLAGGRDASTGTRRFTVAP